MINDIIQLLGIASPQLSPKWTQNAAAAPAFDGAFTLTCPPSDSFVAPCNGVLNTNIGLAKIILPDGTTPASAIILKIDPQVYLRLTHMYASLVEGWQAGNTVVLERPVPCYFVYTQTVKANNSQGAVDGLFLAGDGLNISGKLTIHDHLGFPIDPLAVASAFNLFMQRFATMTKKALNSAATVAAAQLQLLSPPGSTVVTTIHLVSPNGTAYTTGAADFSNLQTVQAAANNQQPAVDVPGLYTVTSTATAIKKGAKAMLRIGAATNGTMGDQYTCRALAAGTNMGRDFLRAYVVSLDTYLIGDPASHNDDAFQKGFGPVIADNEQVALLVNGNECLAAVGSVTQGNPALTLVVSPVIDNDFTMPPAGPGNGQWPVFPGGGAVPATPATIPATIKGAISVTAHFIQDPATKNSDVAVTLSCAAFTPGDSLRIYNRLFNETDGTESRGNGAGAIIAAVNGANMAVFRLKDPFGQVNGIGQVNPVKSPTLMLDAVLVNRSMAKRTFGNLHCKLPAAASALSPAETQLLTAGANNLNGAAERGISPAGIMGTSSTAFTGPATIGDWAGETQPRNAPRYPTMARYDSMAASAAPGTTTWNAFCGGTLFSKEALNNYPLLGNPGSPGGVEYSSVGVQTTGGVLAYEIARAAYRRTRNIFERMANLMFTANANSWNTPAAPAPGAQNTWAAATLQTIADHCETPELALANKVGTLPPDLPTFVSQLQGATVGNPLPGWIPAVLQPRIQLAITNLGANPQYQRGYNELLREVSSTTFGRQDTHWALMNALGAARECIYIQGSFLSHTAHAGDAGNDLLMMLRNGLANEPRLKIIICMGRKIHFGKGYESFEAREYKVRKEAVEFLQGDPLPGTTNRPFADRVLAFHPNGFPMRPKVLQHQVVIVDDMWALVGSSTFRKRGMQFDGSQDVVLFDKKIADGKSAGIRNFRIRLLQEHLNLQFAAGTLPPGLLVRLHDLHDCFDAIRELLQSGGAGLIAPIGRGDRTDIADNLLPKDELADPGGKGFDVLYNSATAFLNSLSTTPA